MEQAILLMRESVKGGVHQRVFGKSRRGGVSQWLPHSEATKAAKDYEPQPLLNLSGTLLEAWMGGAHSVTKVTPRTAEIGVTGLVYAAIQRGGATTDEVTRSGVRGGTSITITPAMRGFLHAVKGIHPGPKKRVIRIPARPHGTPNPDLNRGIRKAALEHLKKTP